MNKITITGIPGAFLAQLPFVPWANLTFKTGEMLMAATVVINQRVWRMMLAGPNPNARDRREFQRMGTEKLEAAVESASAMAWHSLLAAPQTGTLLMQQWMKLMPRLLAIDAQMPATLASSQNAWLQAALAGSSALAAHGMRTFASVAGQGLHPVHKRATANARRLT